MPCPGCDPNSPNFPTGPRKGTLRVFPFVKDATSYIMLRPFMPDVPEDLFPGAIPGKAFHISAKWHPLIHGKLVSVPAVKPGDTVWWHPDLVRRHPLASVVWL